MAGFGSPLGAPLGADDGVQQPSMTDDEARSAILSLLPPGLNNLLNYEDPTDDLYKLFDAFGSFANRWGHRLIDRLRIENTVFNAVERIGDWAAALGINVTSASSDKPISARQAAVTSKLRESGACTTSNIQGALGPLLGYANNSTLQLIEPDRATQKALHTYSNLTGASLGTSSSTSQTVSVSDDGGISNGGIQLAVTLTCTDPSTLSFTLTGPTSTGGGVGTGQASKTWATGSLPSTNATAQTFYLYDASGSFGKYLTGTWTLQISTGSAAATISSWSVFVEGGAQRDSASQSGLGGLESYWAVYADPSLVHSPDYVGARQSLLRLTQGHTHSVVVTNSSSKPGASLTPPFLPRTT